MANTPNIRFKGFADDWEQRKLGELGTLKNGMNFSKDAMGHGYAFVNLQNIFGNSVVDVQNLGLAEASEKQLMEYSLLKGDVLFVRSSVKLEGVGEAALVPENLKDTTYSGFIIRFRDEYGLNDNFKRYVFGTKKVRDQIMAQATNSANKNISQTVLENLTFDISSYEEQKKIGEYFKHLDHLITLHQRKCDEVKQLKKFMLQKMFPKNGKLIPKIRFAGFTDDWEQRKLGEVCTRVQGNDGRMELPTLTISAGNGWMRQEDRFSSNIAGKEQKNYTLLRKGELSYNHGNSKLAKYGAVFSLQTYEEALVPRVYHSFKVIKGNADFVEYYFATKLPDRELGKLISSGARMDGLLNIGYDEFMGIPLLFPTTEEQTRIAIYFRHLDYLITLHQHKCDQLKEVKRFMLQNMFPQKG